MIPPTIGRVVWFWPESPGGPTQKQPFAALVVYVWGDRMVNLAYFDANGQHGAATSVTLLQDDDVPLANGYFCSWMPFQLGQAKSQQDGPWQPWGGRRSLSTKEWRSLSTKENPSEYDCLAKLNPDEPYFVLRGQDLLAPQLVRAWAVIARGYGCPIEKTNDALRCATRMENWPIRKAPE